MISGQTQNHPRTASKRFQNEVRPASRRLGAEGWRMEAESWRQVVCSGWTPKVGGWRLEAGGWRLEAEGWRLEQCGAVRCGAVRCGVVRCGAVRGRAVRCGCESTSFANFFHPSFTHFTSCFGKPPLQGVPVSGDQKQDSGEEPNFSSAAF